MRKTTHKELRNNKKTNNNNNNNKQQQQQQPQPHPQPQPQPQPQQQKNTSCSIQNGEYKGSYLDLEFSLATSLKKIAKVNYQSMIYWTHSRDSLLFERTQQYAGERLQGFLPV